MSGDGGSKGKDEISSVGGDNSFGAAAMGSTGSYHSAAWTGTTGSKESSKPLKSGGLSLAALQAELASEVREWPGDLESAQRTVDAAFSLVREAESGCLFVIAPTAEVAKLKSCVQHADQGYLTKKLKDEKVWSEEFRRVFLDFASYTITERWPDNHPDIAARSQPKDGALVLSSSGGLRKGAAKLIGLPATQYSWPGHGTRHMAALQVATFLDAAVVIVKSDGGGFHILLARQDQRVAAFHVRDDVVRSREPAMPGIREDVNKNDALAASALADGVGALQVDSLVSRDGPADW